MPIGYSAFELKCAAAAQAYCLWFCEIVIGNQAVVSITLTIA